MVGKAVDIPAILADDMLAHTIGFYDHPDAFAVPPPPI